MKSIITKIDLSKLKNETHVEFNESIKRLFIKFNPQTVGIDALYNLYSAALDKELDSLDFIRKSEITSIISEQDRVRDNIYGGLVDSLKGATRHFDPAYSAAATLLLDVFKHYGNIPRKTLDDETAAIKDLLRELQQPALAAALETLGFTNWVDKLAAENAAFEQLMMQRYEQTADKTQYRMKDTRKETDKYYHAIVSQIENMVLVGNAAVDALIREMNTVISRFKHILAQEKGERKEGNL
ncbi:MAG: DUF6261 family protein [Prevotellaceae bacterium]|jgi:hypothetical protein|nr:DUF6261 family protein [Prevotellaceae bacterium]